MSAPNDVLDTGGQTTLLKRIARFMKSSGHRRCIVLRGTPDRTAADAFACIKDLSEDTVLWVSQSPGPSGVTEIPLSAVKRKLGQSFDAVVLNLHEGLNADVLGQVHGFIWGGGALILRMPAIGSVPDGGQDRMAVYPYEANAVGHRMFHRLESGLKRAPTCAPNVMMPVERTPRGTEDQRRVVEQLIEQFGARKPTMSVLLSDRGRGKSSALGQALAQCSHETVAVSAVHPTQAAEIFRFATGTPVPGSSGPVSFVELEHLAFADCTFDLIVIDEAAHVSIHLLQQIVLKHPQAHMAFATTARGYEGTGRGFVLRFLEWLENQTRPVKRLNMSHPIRWDAGDPLETFIFDTLLLDAEPLVAHRPLDLQAVEHVCFDRDEMALNEGQLRQYFGLLIHAHYRTTPADLHRVLDAPNLHLHGLVHKEQIIAATLVAEEGELEQETIESLYWGQSRIRGHALAETLASHLGRKDAPAMSMIRSVRIAVHPELRRMGLAGQLVEAIHNHYQPDLFGTLFGVTPELLKFRRRVGYELIRLGASRGSRTGEPAAVMVHPVSRRAKHLFSELRAELARDLPLQFELLESNDDLHLDPQLHGALLANMPAPAALCVLRRDAMVAAYAFGPRTQESVATALKAFVSTHESHLDQLSEQDAMLIRLRIKEGLSWEQVMKTTELTSFGATMRAMRRAVRSFVVQIDPQFEHTHEVPHQ